MDILKLTNSQTREKILNLYFADPEKKYYLRQLEKILDLPVGNIRRELISLSGAGLFKKEKVGNQVYYYLDKNSPLYNEIKSIISKTIGIQGTLKTELDKIPGIKRAFIFGSFAKSREKSGSDIDLMLVGQPDEDELVKRISQLESRFGREVNYHLFSEKEWEKRSKKDSFLSSVNKGPKIDLI
jgi:predicted nucleotidyltransferase